MHIDDQLPCTHRARRPHLAAVASAPKNDGDWGESGGGAGGCSGGGDSSGGGEGRVDDLDGGLVMLAFSRCGGFERGPQLWASLLEKAYAKAHGSFQAISGGQVTGSSSFPLCRFKTGTETPPCALCSGYSRFTLQIDEALQDLTGFPTEAIDLTSPRLSLEGLWRRLVEFRRLRLPLGCATDGGGDLREVGLYGGHACVRDMCFPGGGR